MQSPCATRDPPRMPTQPLGRPDKEMLSGLITELGLESHVSLCEFTKEPFYVFERCNVVALPSTGKEGLPNVLLEALAMEKPCVATNK